MILGVDAGVLVEDVQKTIVLHFPPFLGFLRFEARSFEDAAYFPWPGRIAEGGGTLDRLQEVEVESVGLDFEVIIKAPLPAFFLVYPTYFQ